MIKKRLLKVFIRDYLLGFVVLSLISAFNGVYSLKTAVQVDKSKRGSVWVFRISVMSYFAEKGSSMPLSIENIPPKIEREIKKKQVILNGIVIKYPNSFIDVYLRTG